MKKSLLIAVDFDGTVVEDRYPAVGKPKPFSIETLKMLQADGHRIILWTYRHGKKLDEAVEFLRNQGVPPYAVNRSYPEEANTPNDVNTGSPTSSSTTETLADSWLGGDLPRIDGLKRASRAGLKKPLAPSARALIVARDADI